MSFSMQSKSSLEQVYWPFKSNRDIKRESAKDFEHAQIHIQDHLAGLPQFISQSQFPSTATHRLQIS